MGYDGRADIASANQEAVQQALSMVQALTREAEVGKIYMGTVRKIAEFGAFVELFPGTDGLIHISELSDKRVKSVSDVLAERAGQQAAAAAAAPVGGDGQPKAKA